MVLRRHVIFRVADISALSSIRTCLFIHEMFTLYTFCFIMHKLAVISKFAISMIEVCAMSHISIISISKAIITIVTIVSVVVMFITMIVLGFMYKHTSVSISASVSVISPTFPR